MVRKKMLFHHLNVSSHISYIVREKLDKLRFLVVPQLACLSDLVPSDSHFPQNFFLAGRKSQANQEVLAAVE